MDLKISRKEKQYPKAAIGSPLLVFMIVSSVFMGLVYDEWHTASADHSGSAFIAMGRDWSAKSTDGGATWTAHAMPDGQWDEVACSDHVCVAVPWSDSGSKFAMSSDGESWEVFDPGLPTGFAVWEIFYDGARFVAFETDQSNALWESHDGTNWTQLPVGGPDDPDDTLMEAKWAENGKVVLRGDGGVDSNAHYSDDDGASWESILEGEQGSLAHFSACNGTWYGTMGSQETNERDIVRRGSFSPFSASSDPTFDGTTFVGVGAACSEDTGTFVTVNREENPFVFARSTDNGATFTGSGEAHGGNLPTHMVWAEDVFVSISANAAQADAFVRSTDDGETWTTINAPENDHWEGLAHGLLATVTRPDPPANLSAKPGAGFGRVELDWQAPVDNGGTRVTGYNIYRSTEEDDEYTVVAVLGPEARSHVDEGMAFRTYFYRVTAVNMVGEGLPSETACSKPSPWVYLKGDNLCWIPSPPD